MLMRVLRVPMFMLLLAHLPKWSPRRPAQGTAVATAVLVLVRMLTPGCPLFRALRLRKVWHDGLCSSNQNIVRIGVDTGGSNLGCRHTAHTFGGIGGK